MSHSLSTPNTKKKVGREKAAGLLEIQSKPPRQRKKISAEKPDFRNALGVVIRESRTANGWTQEQLASRLRTEGFRRCTRSLVSQIEVGAASVRGQEIYYFREVFGKSFEQDFWNPYHQREAGKIHEEEVP